MSREINIPPAHNPLFSVFRLHYTLCGESEFRDAKLEDGSATTNTMPRSNQIFTLVCSSAEQSYADKTGRRGGKKERKKSGSAESTDSHLLASSRLHSRGRDGAFIYLFIFFSWRAFLKNRRVQKCGTPSQEVLLGLSV